MNGNLEIVHKTGNYIQFDDIYTLFGILEALHPQSSKEVSRPSLRDTLCHARSLHLYTIQSNQIQS